MVAGQRTEMLRADQGLTPEAPIRRSGMTNIDVGPADIRAFDAKPPRVTLPPGIGQVVLVLQGGGALGAYQAGVYQALHEAGIEPDWVIGTSIGAINASLIAGNDVADRLPRLRDFWRRVQHGPLPQAFASLPLFGGWGNLARARGRHPGLLHAEPGCLRGTFYESGR
jgi:predicted acylesterase/phospholipase RssA